MMKYQLKDRRPISNLFRRMAYGFVDYCVEKGIHADTISYFSVIFAIIAGVLLYLSSYKPFLLLIAPLFYLLRGYCNMADGMVALKANKASYRGEVINELPDRISDTLIYLGLGLSMFANINLVYWVIFGMLFVSYIGVLGKAVGARRQYGGIMSKPNRMYVLCVACYIQFFYYTFFFKESFFSIIDIFNITILLGLVQTAFVRTRSIFRELKSKEEN